MTKRLQPFDYGDYSDERQAEFDAGNTNVGLVSNYSLPPSAPPANFAPLEAESPLFVDGQRVTCDLDGMAISCQQLNRQAEAGAVGVYSTWSSFGRMYRSYDELVPLGLGLFSIGVASQKDGRRSPNWLDWIYSFSPIVQSENNPKFLVDRAIQDVKDIFKGDDECARFFGLGKVATVYSTENGKESVEHIYGANASIVADDLGSQLRDNIGFLDAGSVNSTTIGIEMSGEITNVQSGTTQYRRWERAKVNSRGSFVGTGSFGSYSGRAGRALAILHEIAHMIRTGSERDKNGRITGSTYLIPNDKDKTDKSGMNQSEANTALIEKKCKKELDALKALNN